MLTAGNVNDSTVAEEMLSSFNLKNKYIYADKGYDTASIVRYIENQGENAVIPSKCNAVNPRKTDWFLYKERHLVENLFLLLYISLLFLFGYIDGFKTRSRITPAHAGKSDIIVFSAGITEDHPRICGEKAFGFVKVYGRQGSPPHMRGKVTS